MSRSAFLIAIFNENVTELVDVQVWSSPEWQQTCCLPNRKTFVAWEVCGKSFHDAKKHLMECISQGDSRHFYLFQKMIDVKMKEYEDIGVEPNMKTIYAMVGL